MLGLASAAATAQPADLPTAEELFGEALRAMGLPEALSEIGTIEAHADVSVTSPQGARTYKTVAIGSITPDQLGDATFEIIRGEGRTVYGETGGKIWTLVDNGTTTALPDAMVAFVRGHQFHRRVLFPMLELAHINPEVVEGEFNEEPVFKVKGTTHAGARLT